MKLNFTKTLHSSKGHKIQIDDYGLGDWFSAWMIGLASMFLLMLLVDIRTALLLIVEQKAVL